MDCSDFLNIYYIYGANCYPVITLNPKVEILTNNQTGCNGDNLGTKQCPYKLTCNEC